MDSSQIKTKKEDNEGKMSVSESPAILKQAGSSRYGKEDPGYLRRWVQMIFSTFFFLKFGKEDPGYLRRFFSNF